MASEENIDKSSPTSEGYSENHSVIEDLPKDNQEVIADEQPKEQPQQSTTTSTFGSFFSNAWSKTAQTANNATTNFSGSSFLSTAFGKVGGSSNTSAVNSEKTTPKVEENPIVDDNAGQTEVNQIETDANSSAAASAFFNSAWNRMNDLTKSASQNITGMAATKETEKEEINSSNKDEVQTNLTTLPEETQPEAEPQPEPQTAPVAANQSSFFSNFSSMVGKVANSATTVIKDKVNSTSIIAEFNKEQEEFIKNKGPGTENGLPPWVGYQDEEAMKAKILSLSKDKRNFVRAPPSGVTFEFDYSLVSSVAMALLQEDPQLENMRYELVPKQVKEDEFWRNYFYRVNLIKQSFELKDLESTGSAAAINSTPMNIDANQTEMTNDEDMNNIPSLDHDDEFVSDSYQASSADIDEVNASMKTLGVKGNEQWEAELEGELNEFEMVSSKADTESNDPEWENQIQQMLDAEENQIN